MAQQNIKPDCSEPEIFDVTPLSPLDRAVRQREGSGDTAGWRFVPPYEWMKRKAKRLQKSTRGLKLAQAQNCLAYVYGFADLDDFRAASTECALPTGLPADVPTSLMSDERLSPEEVEARRAFQARRFYEWLDLNGARYRALVDQFEPSSMPVRIVGDEGSAGSDVTDETSCETQDDHDQSDVDRELRYLPRRRLAVAKSRRLNRLLPHLSNRGAKEGLAFVYGHHGWNQMVDETEARGGTQQQRAPDELLTPEQVKERWAFQARRARRIFGLDVAQSLALIDVLRPSSALSAQGNSEADDLENDHDQRIWRRLNQGGM